MEWVEMTAKTTDEARERALEVLGVAEEDAEIEVLEEPRAGLFGLVRGEARVRARVRPTEVRPKIDRRRNRRSRGASEDAARSSDRDESASEEAPANGADRGRRRRGGGGRNSGASDTSSPSPSSAPAPQGAAPAAADADPVHASVATSARTESEESSAMESSHTPEISPDEVGAAAVGFLEGLVEAFDLDAQVAVAIDGVELDVEVSGNELGLLIGPGGRTLLAVQDLTRVAAQRRLGDHETRLRVDVAGYRQRRRDALERFARDVAEQVSSSGRARSLEPMPSADRKIIHDVIVEIDGVTSRSEGDDPDRRVVVLPE